MPLLAVATLIRHVRKRTSTYALLPLDCDCSVIIANKFAPTGVRSQLEHSY